MNLRPSKALRVAKETAKLEIEALKNIEKCKHRRV